MRISDKRIKKQKAIDRAVEAERTDEFRRKAIKDYFVEFTEPVRPWIQRLADRYKEKGRPPVIPLTIIPSYYEDSKDKEIAALVAALMTERADIEQIGDIRRMMGDSPWKWLRQRGFVHLSSGAMQSYSTGGVANWRIAMFLDKVWEMTAHRWGAEVTPTPLLTSFKEQEAEGYGEVSELLFKLYKHFHTSRERIKLLLVLLSTSDGFGYGLWDIPPQKLRCPATVETDMFLKFLWPDYWLFGEFDECVPFVGLRHEYEFYYASFAYKELMYLKPDECRTLHSRYTSWYTRSNPWIKPYQKRQILPEYD